MKRVNTLYRVSTKKQVDVTKDDIPMQKIACHEFAERQGWTITKEYSEKGISGFKVSAEDRDAIQDLKTAALNKEFDVLLVFMFDRIGRIDDETPFVVEWFVHHGIEVWSVKEGEQRFDSHVDKLTNYIRFWQASGESAKTSARIKTRMQQMVEEGNYIGGSAPYGYRLAKRGRLNKKGNEVYDLEIDPAESEIVRMIFESTVKYGHGSFQLADRLNRMGLRTHSGAKFQCNSIIRMLKNKIYCGYIQTKNACSPFIESIQIIDEDVFDMAQEILQQREKKNNSKRTVALKTKGESLLSGNIFCGHCGGRMVATTYHEEYVKADGTKSIYHTKKYTCYHRSRKLNDCDGQAAYRADIVEEKVLSAVKSLFDKIKTTPEQEILEHKFKNQAEDCKVKKRQLEQQLEKQTKQLETLQAEIGNSLIGNSVYSSDDLAAAIKIAKKSVEDTKAKLDEVTSKLEEAKNGADNVPILYQRFLGWANEFDTASNEQKKMIICGLCDRIEVSRDYEVRIVVDMDYGQFCG